MNIDSVSPWMRSAMAAAWLSLGTMAARADEVVIVEQQSSGSTVAVAEDLTAPEAASVAAAPQGELRVAANAQRTLESAPATVQPASPPPVRIDDAVQPAAAHSLLGFDASQNRQAPRQHAANPAANSSRPPISAGIQNIRSGSRFQGDRTYEPRPQWSSRNHAAVKKTPALSAVQSNSSQSSPEPSNATQAPSNAAATTADEAPLQSAEQVLLAANEASQAAKSQADYSQVVRQCAVAMQQGLMGDNRQFALQLSAWALNRRGSLRADEDQTELALADFQSAIEFDPTCWRAHHNRSVSLAQQGKFAEAFDDVSRALDLNPRFAKGFSNRATLYMQAGDIAQALADYDKALALEPKLFPALVGRGRLCHLQGRQDDALANFTAALAVQTDADVACSRADVLADLGRYKEAMEDYAQAIELNAKFEHAYRNGAWLLATCPDESIRDVEGAIAGAKQALACGYGERHAALDTLAAALANAGKFEEAVGTLQQAIEIAPDAAKEAYQARLSLYESRQPYRTQPVGGIQPAEYEGE